MEKYGALDPWLSTVKKFFLYTSYKCCFCMAKLGFNGIQHNKSWLANSKFVMHFVQHVLMVEICIAYLFGIEQEYTLMKPAKYGEVSAVYHRKK